MDDTQPAASPAESVEAPIVLMPKEEKKPEGIEHDPYEWGKCAITANIVWLPDGSIMLGARNHLDAPVVRLLAGDELVSLPGHAAELPIPTSETIADLLAQLREELPLRAQAKAERDKAAEARQKPAAGRKNAKPAPAALPAAPHHLLLQQAPPLGKSPPWGKPQQATKLRCSTSSPEETNHER